MIDKTNTSLHRGGRGSSAAYKAEQKIYSAADKLEAIEPTYKFGYLKVANQEIVCVELTAS